MEGFSGVLVALLSTVAVVFSFVVIVLIVLLLRISRQIKAVNNTTDKTIEEIGASVRRSSAITSPIHIVRFLAGHIKKRTNKRRKKLDVKNK